MKYNCFLCHKIFDYDEEVDVEDDQYNAPYVVQEAALEWLVTKGMNPDPETSEDLVCLSCWKKAKSESTSYIIKRTNDPSLKVVKRGQIQEWRKITEKNAERRKKEREAWKER
jgi:hypothetical protein